MSKPFSRQTSIRRAPFDTSSSLPLTVILIGSEAIIYSKPVLHLRGAIMEALLEIFGKSVDRRLNGPGGRITKGTERLALDVVAKIEHQLRVVGLTLSAGDA